MKSCTQLPETRPERPSPCRLDRFHQTRRFRLLPGKFNSLESLEAYGRLDAELADSPKVVINSSNNLTVNELLAAYLEFAAKHYSPDGSKPSKELVNLRYAIRPLREPYGMTNASEFGPFALRAVRQRMVNSGLSHNVLNHHVNRIRRMIRWAVAEQIVPPGNLEALRALPGLQRGRTEAKETKPVKPVADATVWATLPYLPHHVRALVEMMFHTGMRPHGQLVQVRSRPWVMNEVKQSIWNAVRGLEGAVRDSASVRSFGSWPSDLGISPVLLRLRLRLVIAAGTTGRSHGTCRR